MSTASSWFQQPVTDAPAAMLLNCPWNALKYGDTQSDVVDRALDFSWVYRSLIYHFVSCLLNLNTHFPPVTYKTTTPILSTLVLLKGKSIQYCHHATLLFPRNKADCNLNAARLSVLLCIDP